jgi:hypothetical protein
LRWLVAGLILAFVCASCVDASADAPLDPDPPATHAQAISPPAPGSIEALEMQLAAASAEVDSDFVDEFFPESAQKLIASARDRWRARLQACGDDACRREILSDQLNRIDYSRGRNARPVAGLPWPTGALDLRTEYAIGPPQNFIGGGISIFPIIDDQLLISAGTVDMPNGRWSCSMDAEGRFAAGQVLEMRSLDVYQRLYFFRPVGHGRWSLGGPGGYPDPHCGLNAFEAEYDVEFRRSSSDESDEVEE